MTGDRVAGAFRRVWRAVAKQTAVGIGAVLLGLAALVSSGGWAFTAAADREHLDDLRRRNGALTEQIDALTAELTCRSVAATEASNIQAEIGLWTARGLAAYARGDDSGLAEAAVEIEVLTLELGPALERRTESVAACADGTPAPRGPATTVPPSPTPIPVPPLTEGTVP